MVTESAIKSSNKPSAQKDNNYQNNFNRLKEIATRLQNDTEVDLDELVPMLERATESYEHCKARIEAVEKILAEKLKKDGGSD